MMRSALNIIAIFALAVSPVLGVSEQLLDLMDALQCSEPDALCGPISVNCSFNSARGDTWLEITDNSNMTQYASITPNVTVADMPDPVPPPYTLSADDTAAPANGGTCFSRSPGVPENCTDDCLVQSEIFDIDWLMFGELICSGLYPKSDSSQGLSDPIPPPGSVNVVATKQCKDYNYVPPWMGVVTDEWGSKWALQTSQEPMADDADWAENIASVVWPEGWTYENVTLTTNQTHVSYLMGNECWSFVLKDSQGNAWHMFEYPEEIGTSVFANIDCVPLKLTTAEEMEGETGASSAALDVFGTAGVAVFAALMAFAAI